jgi:hypothetical protein
MTDKSGGGEQDRPAGMEEGEGGGGRDDQQEKDESVNKDEAVKVYGTDENLAREQEGRVSFSSLLSQVEKRYGN